MSQRDPMQPTEAEVQKGIIDYLHAMRIWHRRINTGATKYGDRLVRFSEKGMPDIIGALRGRFFAIEVKSKTGRLSPEQEQTLADIRRAGGIAIVARSVDDVIRGLG